MRFIVKGKWQTFGFLVDSQKKEREQFPKKAGTSLGGNVDTSI